MIRKIQARFSKMRTKMMTDAQLISELRTQANATVLEMLNILKERECLQNGTFVGADLSGIQMQNALVAMSNFERVRFCGGDLSHAYLGRCNLIQADFSATTMTYANLREAQMNKANFGGAILHEAHFADSTLWSADFSGASLQQANFWGANLKAAKLRDADLSGATLTNAQFDIDTILPDGTRWSSEVDMSRFTG